jgi:hypothetical protein
MTSTPKWRQRSCGTMSWCAACVAEALRTTVCFTCSCHMAQQALADLMRLLGIGCVVRHSMRSERLCSM